MLIYSSLFVFRVKQRKLLSERHKKEEAERKEKLRKEQEELFVKQKSRQEREKTKRQLAETRMLAVHVRRRVPLGTDRNHSRYITKCTVHTAYTHTAHTHTHTHTLMHLAKNWSPLEYLKKFLLAFTFY